MLSIISTVGTTVFGKYESPLATKMRELENENLSHVDIAKIKTGKFESAEPIFEQALADLKAKSGEFLRRATAEINAIEGVHDLNNVRSGNEYWFIASHTASGVLAARVLAAFCAEHYQATHSEVAIIQGLQVKDARAFRLTGLPMLVKKLYELIDSAKAKHFRVVLNPTGGFKAAIPYITLVGMLRQSQGVQVSLIHETSTELITLADLPISLNINAIAQIRALLEQCDAEQNKGVPQDEVVRGLGLTRREMVENHPLWSLFEQFDSNHYILSGLGEIALKELQTSARQTVWLSKQAHERFSASDNNLQAQLTRIFEQMRDTEWVKLNLHATNKDKLKILKPSGAERPLFYYQDDGSLVIADIGLKNDGSYDRISRDFDILKRIDYPLFSAWEGR